MVATTVTLTQLDVPMRSLALRPLRWMFLPLLLLYGTARGTDGPRSPGESIKAFVLADPLLTIELVASEPDVTSPVAIAWDEDGRLYVAEMNDYPAAAASGRIRRLEDRDGDGRYERVTVFADGLPFPNGVMPCLGGVLVTAAPNIWFLRDNDGDGRADEKSLMLSGFGEGNTQLRVNGLYLGLDNKTYAANGRSDGDVRSRSARPGFPVSIRRRDLRFLTLAFPGPGGTCAPEVVRAEAIAGYSQFGLAHDDWGNRFPSWNTIPIRHVVLEQQSLDRNPYLAETSSVAPILEPADGGRIFGISPAQARFNRESVAYFNASCGPIINRGDLLPAQYRGDAFVCEPLTNLVHHRALEPAGVTFLARRVEQGREFLASSDPAFRPVNLATGPDGALYVVDMYRELVEHPQFVPESARGTVDFRRWHNRGRIWRIRPTTVTKVAVDRPNFSKTETVKLVGLLRHANGWWRSTAQRLIVERLIKDIQARRDDPQVTQLLIGVLRDKTNALARLHALWILAAVERVDEQLLSAIASDPHPGIREHALRVAADRREQHAQAKQLLSTSTLVKLADDPAIRVRFHAALALGDRCRNEPAALEALAKIAAKDADDPWMRLAILSGLAESSLAFLPLSNTIPSAIGRREFQSQAAAIVGVRRQMPELVSLLETIRSHWRKLAISRDVRLQLVDSLAMMEGLAHGLERSGPPLSSLVSTPPAELKSSLDRMESLWPAASELAVSGFPARERLIAIEVLARGRPDIAETVIPTLLSPTQPPEIQLGAARAVAISRRPSLASKALGEWSKLAVGTRRELLAGLISNPALAPSLIQALEQEFIAPGELDGSARAVLEHLPDAKVRERASRFLAKSAPPERSDALARYQAALKLEGNPGRGANVFTKNCQTCHQRQGQGHRVGPDLSGIAGRAPDALLSDIIDPNREVAPDYATLSVATRGGQVFAGLLAEETATTLKLRRAEGVEDTLLRSEIDELRSTGKSLMPEGLEQNIILQEMADLIAFLREGR
jgi:putative membrane-bound dehydrogenase-like protein